MLVFLKFYHCSRHVNPPYNEYLVSKHYELNTVLYQEYFKSTQVFVQIISTPCKEGKF